MQAPIQMPAIATTRTASMTTHFQWPSILRASQRECHCENRASCKALPATTGNVLGLPSCCRLVYVSAVPIVSAVVPIVLLDAANVAEPRRNRIQARAVADIVADTGRRGGEGLDLIIAAETRCVDRVLGFVDDGRDTAAVCVVEGTAARCAGGQELVVGEGGDGGYRLLG